MNKDKQPKKSYRVKCRSYDIYGRGVVSFNQSKIPVEGLIGGEMAHICLKHTKTETIGILKEIEETSPERVTPPCPYHSRCGACQLMHMSYGEQLRFKEQMVREQLGKYCSVSPIIGMDDPTHYRNKVHASFGRDRQGKIMAGIYEAGSHHIVPIENCLIQNRTANEIIADIRKIAGKLNIAPYDEDRHTGILRHVLIRTAYATGQVMVVPVVGRLNFKERQPFIKQLLACHPEITTIVLNCNDAATSMVLGDREEVVYGDGTIEDELCGLKFCISPKSFYQVNPIQTQKLYEAAAEAAGLSKEDQVIDAYSGIGTIGLSVSRLVRSVTCVEINRAAVKNARENAAKNGITNIEFACRDAGQWIQEKARKGMHADVIFLDPPRSGCSMAFVRAMLSMHPDRIVYISCNAVTQKRDIEMMVRHGYEVTKLCPVDMFAMSYHTENIAVLKRKFNGKAEDS